MKKFIVTRGSGIFTQLHRRIAEGRISILTLDISKPSNAEHTSWWKKVDHSTQFHLLSVVRRQCSVSDTQADRDR
jgi:hypothetical protein